MAAQPEGDLGVDVLIIGGGIMGHYLAKSLAGRYTVCMVTDPAVRVETTEAEGYFSAGYDGNDANRIQPARRAVGYWKLWAESNGIQNDESVRYCAVAPDDEVARTRLWLDASLVFRKAESLPPAFAGGSIAGHVAYEIENDLVINPAHVLNRLRDDIGDCHLSGEVTRFVMASDAAIDYVEVEIGGETIPIVPRFTVLAASGGNAGLLQKVAMRTRDNEKRKERVELAKTSQAVRKRFLLLARGNELPMVSGHFGGLQVACHPLSGTTERLWIVNPPIDDTLTTLGQEDQRFEVMVDPKVVSSTVQTLFAMSPEVERIAHKLKWSAYTRRKTEHPMMAAADTTSIGQPAPAKIETFGMEGFMALWPSHLAYSMIVGDVATERITEALGAPADFSDGISVSHLAAPAEPLTARWDSPDLSWQYWDDFAKANDIS